MKQVLAPIIALVIGIGTLAFMAISPQVCHAAAGGSATVARSIFVSKKGSGADFTRIQDAINSVPFANRRWIRIHIAAGVYKEKVSIPANKSFILLEGEGRQQTSIEWADHAGGGGGDSGTADSPTFASYAADFMARDITFKNTYGRMAPAVAALVAGDRSAFYRCGFVGLQDTLSDLLGRHYYERCYVEGAVDFIFGEAQSIFHRCHISTAAAAAPGFITAQGRSSASDASGETLEMVESGCTGPGSNRTGRVPWEKTLSGEELAKLVDISYVSRDGWLAAQPR
ncbi:hypothetical protein OsJ_01434 [Oryza sativa Japonica Group]|uniref:Pectinesterase n=1 Tax=Oryza sativa subsp. japonica TaxID=39947 RepID=A2ZS70_ORYSJ|nr:hypothetical protein OsJ_01434 [Oryza sativa Japonica Group]